MVPGCLVLLSHLGVDEKNGFALRKVSSFHQPLKLKVPLADNHHNLKRANEMCFFPGIQSDHISPFA
jgi:hypothetical protein